MGKTVSGSRRPKIDNVIDSSCIVHFRPADNWRGEYGFDWYRIGDTPEYVNAIVGEIKSSYDDIVGKYSPQDPDYNKPCILQKDGYAENLKKEEYPFFLQIKGSDEKYRIPFVTLFYESTVKSVRKLPRQMLYRAKDKKLYRKVECRTSAEIKLIIFATNISKISFECDDGIEIITDNKGNPNEILNIPNATKALPHIRTITISHKYRTGNSKAITAYAYTSDGREIIAGKMYVVEYDPMEIEIRVMPIFTESGRAINSGAIVKRARKELSGFLSQACVIPNIQTLTVGKDKSQTDVNNLLNKYRQNVVKNNINVGYYLTLEKNGNYLVNELNSLFSHHNEYWIFLIDAPHDGGTGMAINIPGNAAVVLNNNYKSTTCHELLHCLGLYHSFSNFSKHTFEIRATSNIMDYYSNDDHYSLWCWQLKKIRSCCSNIELDLREGTIV